MCVQFTFSSQGTDCWAGHARRTKQSLYKVFQSQLSMPLCKRQPTRHEVICRYVCNLNHMVHRAHSEVRLPSEPPSEPWQQHYRASGREFGLRCSRPDEHTGRTRWRADQEAETGRCQPGCLQHRQREQKWQGEHDRVTFVSNRGVRKVWSCESHLMLGGYKTLFSQSCRRVPKALQNMWHYKL